MCVCVWMFVDVCCVYTNTKSCSQCFHFKINYERSFIIKYIQIQVIFPWSQRSLKCFLFDSFLLCCYIKRVLYNTSKLFSFTYVIKTLKLISFILRCIFLERIAFFSILYRCRHLFNFEWLILVIKRVKLIKEYWKWIWGQYSLKAKKRKENGRLFINSFRLIIFSL